MTTAQSPNNLFSVNSPRNEGKEKQKQSTLTEQATRSQHHTSTPQKQKQSTLTEQATRSQHHTSTPQKQENEKSILSITTNVFLAFLNRHPLQISYRGRNILRFVVQLR